MPVIQNSPGNGKRAVVRANGNTTFQLTDIATPNTSVETVTNMNIAKVMWSGNWIVSRGAVGGANTVLQLSGTGTFDFEGHGITFSELNSSNVVVQTADTASSIVIQLAKTSNYTGPN